MPLPSALDINPFDDLDGRRAQDQFLGKSLEEAFQPSYRHLISRAKSMLSGFVRAMSSTSDCR